MGGRSTNDDGFIMVDALTGVVIISLMVGVCLATVKIGRQFSESAQGLRASQNLLQSLMATVPRIPGHYTGKSGGLAYSVDVNQVGTRDAPLCQIGVSVTPPSLHHVYKLSGTRWCAEPQP